MKTATAMYRIYLIYRRNRTLKSRIWCGENFNLHLWKASSTGPQNSMRHLFKWGFPKIRGTILGVPIIRTIVFGGLYWGPPFLGNYQINPIRTLQPSASSAGHPEKLFDVPPVKL